MKTAPTYMEVLHVIKINHYDNSKVKIFHLKIREEDLGWIAEAWGEFSTGVIQVS